jgi:hypothetical protein
VTFAYDPNGLDFEAAWTDAKVRVALEAAEGVVPVLALDAGFPALDLKAPSETFRNVEARLRVTYVGSQTAAPGYTVGILLRAEDLTPSEPSVDGLQDVSTGSKALPPAFQNPLQVSRVQADASGETVSFTYGKAPTVSLAGPDGTLHYAPTVLREIALPQRSLRLDWEPQALPDAFAQFGGDQGLEPRWSFGLEAVSEEGAPTYRRTAPGECAPTATQPVSSFSFTERPAPPGPEETGVPSWVRQSRHFAFASTPGTGGACKTFVRDRWILQETGRKPNPGPLQTHRSFAGNDDGDIPTFEWDPRERSLIPVPGEMTRRLDWEPGTNHPPDPHRAGHRDRTAAWGLMGGMMPAGDGSGAHPAGALGGTVRLTPIQCDPIRHEAIMGAIAGGSVAPQLFWAPSSVDLFTQQVAGNFQNIQQGMQRDLAAAADRQALSTHQSVLAQAAHDARMATIQGQMAGRAQAQIEQAQARSQAWPHPPEGADAASLRERFQPRFEALDRIQEDLQRVRETQDQVEASHQRIAEGLNRVAENRRLAKEAKKLAEAQRNKEKVAGAGVFWLNRKISGDTPKIGFISHTFTFTTNPDGTLLHTYSWGNQGFNGAWIQDAIDDRIAANKALNDPQYFNFISGADFVPDVDRAFRALAGMSSEAHKNFIITSNCKDETDALVNMAIRIHSSTKP